MSRTIDEKVVKMEFDNKNFESNVKTSMSTIDRLKEKLNFSKSAEAFSEIDRASQRVSLSNIADSVDNLEHRFSAMGIVAMRVLQNITDMAFNAAKSIASFVTSGIMSGGYKRASNIQIAQFQLEGLKVAWDDIKDDIDYGVKDTAYGLDAAARAASQLVASQVQVGDEMKRALRGISGVSAMTNSEYEDMARIFTTVAGNGRVMGDQLLQLGTRGLNAAATLKDFFNNVNEGTVSVSEKTRASMEYAMSEWGKFSDFTEQDIREMVSKGLIDFNIFAEAMDTTFGEHAKAANRTFTGAMSNIKAALSRLGEGFYTTLIANRNADFTDDFKNLVDVFNSIMPVIDGIKKALAPLYTDFKFFVDDMSRRLMGFFDSFVGDKAGRKLTEEYAGIVERLSSAFIALGNIITFIVNNIQMVNEAFSNTFGSSIIDAISRIISKISELTSGLRSLKDENGNTLPFYDSLRGSFEGIFSVLKSIFDIAKTIVNFVTPILTNVIVPVVSGIIKLVTTLAGQLGKVTKNFLSIFAGDSFLQKLANDFNTLLIPVGEKINKFFDYLVGANGKITSFFNTINGALINIKKLGLIGWLDSMEDKFIAMGEPGIKFINTLKSIAEWFQKLKDSFDKTKIAEIFDKLKKSFSSFSDDVKHSGALEWIVNAFNKVVDTFIKVKSVIGPILADIGRFISEALKTIGDTVKGFFGNFDSSTLVGGGFIAALTVIVTKLRNIVKELDFKTIKDGVLGVFGQLRDTLVTYQNSIKVDVIKNIAIAVGILAASLIALSFIDGDALTKAVAVLTLVMAGLVLAMKTLIGASSSLSSAESFRQELFGFLNRFTNQINFAILGFAAVELGIALTALAAAIAIFSKIDWKNALPGVVTAAAFMIGFAEFVKMVAKLGEDSKFLGPKIAIIAAGMIEMSVALDLLALACIAMSFAKPEGVISTLLMVAALIAAVKVIAKGENPLILAAATTTILAMGIAMTELATVCGIMALIPWHGVEKAAGMMGALTLCVMALELAFGDNKQMTKIAAGIVAFSTSLLLLVPAVVAFAAIPEAGLIKATAAIASLLTTLVIFTHGIEPVIETFNKLGKTLRDIGIAMAAVGLAMLEFSVSLELLAKNADKVPKAMAAVAEGIISFVKSLADGVADLVSFAVDLVVKFIESLLKSIASRIESMAGPIVDIVLKLLDILDEKAPIFVDKLISIFVKVVETLGNRIDEILNVVFKFIDNLLGSIGRVFMQNLSAETLAGFLGFTGAMALFLKLFAALKDDAVKAIPAATFIIVFTGLMGAIVVALAQMNPDILIPVMLSFSEFVGVMAIVLKVLSGIPVKGAITAVEDLGIFVGALTIIVAALAGLNKIPGFKEFMEGGVEIFEIIGSAIGRFISAIGEALTAGLVSMADNLNDFMDRMVTFANKAKGIDQSAVDGVTALSKMILILLAAEVLNALTGWMSSDNSFQEISDKIINFADTFIKFAEKIRGSGLSDQDIANANIAAQGAEALALFAKNIPGQGGAWQKLAGVKDLEDFGNKVEAFIVSLLSATQALRDVSPAFGEGDITNFQNAAKCGTALTEMAKTIPRTGGIWQEIAGNKDIDKFGEKVVTFIDRLMEATMRMKRTPLTDSDKTNFDNAAKCGTALTEMAQTIPKTGGFWQKLAGNKDIDAFGEKAKTFANAIASLATDLKTAGFDDSSVELIKKVVAAGEALSGLTVALSGGLADLFNGSANIYEWKTLITSYSSALVTFSNDCQNVDFNAMEQGCTALYYLAEMLGKIASAEYQNARDFVQAIETLGFTSVEKFITSFQNSAPKVQAVINTWLNGIANIFISSNLPKQLEDVARQSVTGFSNTLKNSSNSIRTISIGLAKSVTSGFDDLPKLLYECAANSMSKFIEGIKSKSPQAVATAKSIGQGAASSMSDYNDAYQAGSYTGLGFYYGLIGQQWNAWNAGSYIGQMALNGLKATLDLGSPSKITTQFGIWTGEGLGNGMLKSIAYVNSSASKLGDEAIDVIKETVGRISDAIDDDIDTQPTIRPVLDLSEIQNGVSDINSLVNGSSYNIGLVSSRMASGIGFSSSNDVQSIYNDSKVVEAINSLESRLDSVATRMENLQVVLDTGTLVGETAPIMNDEFGNMDVLSQRGVM